MDQRIIINGSEDIGTPAIHAKNMLEGTFFDSEDQNSIEKLLTQTGDDNLHTLLLIARHVVETTYKTIAACVFGFVPDSKKQKV